MPSKYDRDTALPLRVPAELRAELDELVDQVPAALRLPRNSVAVAALTRGLVQLRAELARDPLAVHKALAGDAPDAGAPTVNTSTKASASAERAPPPTAARAGRTSTKGGARTPRAPTAAPVDGEALGAPAVLARFLAAEVKVATFARTHGIARSTLQMWAAGERPLNAKALAKVVKGLDVEGK